VWTLRIELVFRTEDGERFEIRDSSSDFEGHAHGATLKDGEVIAYAGRRWLVRREPGNAERYICTQVDERD
jgi:hypothetical protein